MRASLLAAVALLACAGHARAGRFLLFTTQRSGSTWFCDVLARQPGVQCGVADRLAEQHVEKLGAGPAWESEMMIKYSHMKNRVVEGYNYSTVPWAKWRADSEAQWARLTASHERHEIPAIGYLQELVMRVCVIYTPAYTLTASWLC